MEPIIPLTIKSEPTIAITLTILFLLDAALFVGFIDFASIW